MSTAVINTSARKQALKNCLQLIKARTTDLYDKNGINPRLYPLCKAIIIQRHDKYPAAIPRNGTCGKQVKNDLVLSIFCCIIERIERDVDSALLKEPLCMYISVWIMTVDQRCQNRSLLIVARKRLSKSYFPIKYYIFFVADLKLSTLASYHTSRSMHCLGLDTQ